MAELRSTTAIGGNIVWHGGNLRFDPQGETVLYNGYKLYTENDKPDPHTDLTVPVVKLGGDTMTGDLVIAKATAQLHLSSTANTDASLYLTEDSGNHGVRYHYDGDVNQWQIIRRESGAENVVMYGSRSNNNVVMTGIGYVNTTQRIFADNYHPNADVWTTARTLTIGETGKSVNGSANVSWSLAEIGAAADTGDSTKTFDAYSINLTNIEKSNLDTDGELGFDSSQGLLVYRTQQGVSSAAVTVLDGANVKAGHGLSISNLLAGGMGTETFTFDVLSAPKWSTARTLTLSGDVSGSVSIDGSSNVTLSTAVANDSHTHDGRYYTEAEADGRFVNSAGDTMTGDLNLDSRSLTFNSGASLIRSTNPGTALIPGTDRALNIYGAVNGHVNVVLSANDANDSFNVISSEGTATSGHTYTRRSFWVNGQGNTYAAGNMYVNNSQRVFADNYHPNADSLTTARTINGTSFNGTANITTANWGSTRTLTIGNTGKSVNGSGNVSWSLSEMGAFPLNTSNGTPVAAYYLKNGTGTTGTKIRLPYNTNAGKVVIFTVRVYQNHEAHDVQFSGYLYGSINQWYAPKAIMIAGTNSISVRMGRDDDGRAYVWLAGGNYRGVAVLDVVSGYSTANWTTGWSITESDSTPNLALSTTVQPVASVNGANATGTWPISISGSAPSLTTARTINGTSFNGTGNITTANWGTARTLSLSGDASGSVSINGSSNVTLSVTVANDSHTHDGRYYTESESNARYVLKSGDTMTGVLTTRNPIAASTSVGNTGSAIYGGIVRLDATNKYAMPYRFLTRISSGYQMHHGIGAWRSGSGWTGGTTISCGNNDVGPDRHFRFNNDGYIEFWVTDSQNTATLRGNITGNAATATWADTVDVNTSTSTSFYGLVWHSGDTLYASENQGLTVRPSDGFTKIKHGYFGNERLSHDTIGRIIARNTSGRRAGMYGTYDSNKIAHIWSMGASYMIDDSGATFGNLYGLAYKHTNNTTGGTMAGGHQMVWVANGTGKSAMGDNLWTSGNVTAYSDIRVKTNIERIQNPLDKISKIGGYTYDRTDQDCPRQTGVIAQEILEVLPEAVTGGPTEDDPEGHYSVAYGNIVGLLIEGIKEEKRKREALEERLARLEALLS